MLSLVFRKAGHNKKQFNSNLSGIVLCCMYIVSTFEIHFVEAEKYSFDTHTAGT